MSNAFRGQTQYMQSPMGYGGYGVGGLGGDSYAQLGGGMGGYGNPFSSSLGGYGTTFGGMNMGGYGGGYSQPSLVPQYQPTINDAFSRYFSQQYYGGDAFNPFAATSLFGGGYGGGFGGGRRGGMGGRMRRRRQMFEDMFGPQQPVAQPAPALPEPMPAQDLTMYAGGSPGFYSQQQPAIPMSEMSARASFTPPPQREPAPPGYHYELGGALVPDSTVYPADTGPVAATGTYVGQGRTFTGPNALTDGFNAMFQDRMSRQTTLPPQFPSTIDFSPIQRMGAVPMIYGGSFF